MRFEIKIQKEYAELIFYHYQYGEIISLLDIEDIFKIENKKMHLFKSRGQFRIRMGNHQYLHRFITNCPDYMVVDHINHNTLDNRKCNLRVCTQSENQRNRKISKNNKTGYSGIRIKNNLFTVEIGKNRKYIGTFKNIEDAIKVRNKYLIENGYKINDNESEVEE